MLHASFSHLYFRQSLHTLQRGLAAIADLLVKIVNSSGSRGRKIMVLFGTGTKGFINTIIIYDVPTSFSSKATLILLGFYRAACNANTVL